MIKRQEEMQAQIIRLMELLLARESAHRQNQSYSCQLIWGVQRKTQQASVQETQISNMPTMQQNTLGATPPLVFVINPGILSQGVNTRAA